MMNARCPAAQMTDGADVRGDPGPPAPRDAEGLRAALTDDAGPPAGASGLGGQGKTAIGAGRGGVREPP